MTQLTFMPRFIAPTLDECLSRAKEIGLPEIEAEEFFYHYASKGWKVGKVPMVNWHMAMGGWRSRWKKRQGESQAKQRQVSPSVKVILWQNELKRVEESMAKIKNYYGSTSAWDDEDRQRYKQLKARRAELMQMLGMKA